MGKTSQALQFLRERASVAGDGARLPTVRLLAREAGVSHFTMSKALRVLSSEGVLSARPRAGVVVRSARSGAGDLSGPAVRLGAKWEQLALVLGRRVRDLGANPPAGLLLPKQVCVEFGVSYLTARKALDRLVEQRILVPYSRGFAAVGTHGYGGMGVLCTTRSAREYGTVDEGRITRVFANQLERVCAQEGVPLEYAFLGWGSNGIEGIAEAGDRLRQLARRWPRAMAIVQTPGLEHDSTCRVCEALQTARVPVAVVDFDNRVQVVKLPRYRLGFAGLAASRRPGEIVGEFLVAKGYRRVGVIGSESEASWQRERREGIMSRVGQRTSGVRFFPYALPAAQPQRTDTAAFVPPLLADEVRLYPRLLGQVGSDAEQTQSQYQLRQRMAPLLGSVFSRDRPDVLVGLNDSMAVAALDVLYRMGVEVPGQCAVVGFDDSSLAFAAHLTSYNFNWHAVSREILRFGYTCPEGLARPFRIEVDGYVVERLTTRAAA